MRKLSCVAAGMFLTLAGGAFIFGKHLIAACLFVAGGMLLHFGMKEDKS